VGVDEEKVEKSPLQNLSIFCMIARMAFGEFAFAVVLLIVNM
jgi:hypothetical protein